MILELRHSLIIDIDKIVSLHIETKSGVCGNYNIYIVSTLDGKDFHVKEDDYNTIKNILIHHERGKILTIWYKVSNFASQSFQIFKSITSSFFKFKWLRSA